MDTVLMVNTAIGTVGRSSLDRKKLNILTLVVMLCVRVLVCDSPCSLPFFPGCSRLLGTLANRCARD